MDWHLTWQDPWAIGLAVLGLLFAFWLRRSVKADSGCNQCGPADQPEKTGITRPTTSLRIGRSDQS